MQQPGAYSDSVPQHTVQLHDHPGSEQRQGVRDEEQFIFWTRLTQKTSIVHATPESHVGTHGSDTLLQAVLKPDSP